MGEGFRREQQARQQALNEMTKGLKNEENARQMVQKDPAVMNEEIKNLKMDPFSLKSQGPPCRAIPWSRSSRVLRCLT